MNETFYTIIPGEIYLTDESLITDGIASFDEQQLFDLDICQKIEICDIVTQESKEGETNGQSIEEETDCSTDVLICIHINISTFVCIIVSIFVCKPFSIFFSFSTLDVLFSELSGKLSSSV
jgi:hypothetical protein